MYHAKEILDCYSSWRGYYQENDDRGESCVNYVFGDQWDNSTIQDRALRGEESMMFNMAQKYLMRVKGEAEKLELSLKVHCKNVDPLLVKEGQYVIEQMILCNDNLSAFQKVLNQVYDYGYGAILVTTKQCNNLMPYEQPYLQVLTDPKKVFFDPACDDDFKTEGKFCGIRYTVQRKDLIGHDKPGHRGEKDCDVIDFWYREPCEETWYFSKKGKWTQVKEADYYIKKKIQKHKVKFIRLVDGEITEGPIDYYTASKLPIVYWKGLEGHLRQGATRKVKTMPYVYNLVDSQSFMNYMGSAIVGRLKKLGGSKVIVTDQMIEGKENFWSDFNRRSGVLQVNESDDGTLQQPMMLPADQLDANLLNGMQMSMQLMEQLAGITQAQQGEGGQVATNAGLHRQIMQGNILQNVILSNHLRAINETGRVLTEMIPEVVIEQRDIGQGIEVNKPGSGHTPSNPEIRNDVRELFEKICFSIHYGSSSDAEKAANLVAIKEILSTNPNIAPYLADEFAENLNTANSDKLKRRLEALMPPGIQEVGEGSMSVEEFRQMQQQQQQQQQQQPSIEQQKLELEKQKIEGDQQLKQADFQLKAAKLQNQGAKDAQNLKIKEAGVLAKMQPKEMVYEKG